MNIISIFRLTGINRGDKSGEDENRTLSGFFKNKFRAGISLMFSILVLYLIVTLFAIYNLLVSL